MRRTTLLSWLPIVQMLLQAPVAIAQCTTTNATSCQCPPGMGADCDLLPDVTISWFGLVNYLSGPNEQAGRVYISGSTPNIGYGPLEVRGVDLNGNRRFVCGVDTFTVYDPSASQQFACPNGGTAKQLTTQRIFHKNGNAMTSVERVMPQGMTYHPTHGHTHYDQWGIYSLRLPEPGVTDPRQWPIINQGYKLGFCLMDYNTCSDAAVNHHCKDDNTVYGQGMTLTGPDFPNFGLGGPYGCSMVRQGISSGYTDIYSEYLDGMWIDIPSGTCNGDYWIVYEVDPLNVALETDEDNNWTAVPITLTQQPAGAGQALIRCDEQPVVCPGTTVRLYANAGLSYLWSTGETTNSIQAGPGSYSVTVTNYCGAATSSVFTVTQIAQPAAPSASGVSICEGDNAILNASGTNLVWYDAMGSPVGSGGTFTTPPLYTTTTYQVADVNEVTGTQISGGPADNSGSGAYHAGGQGLRFDVHAALRLKTVKVYAGSAGYRTIELVDAVGVLRASRSVNLPAGQSTVQLDLDVPPGNNYYLTVTGMTDLWRGSSGISYPYAIGTVATITGSSGGAGFYYYFYDWQVEVGGGTCASAMTPVVVDVQVCTGVEGGLSLRGFQVYPNPNTGVFTLELHLLRDTRVDLTLMDAVGRVVYVGSQAATAGHWRHPMHLEGLPAGIYHLNVDLEGRRFSKRVVMQ
ncbi:MAG: T9SS type A sorting domain-containing protein [Flavobacteriales bacterium]|nr:T9SS type A sorting domain-containing protein [Flavobacteriales bacterium]